MSTRRMSETKRSFSDDDKSPSVKKRKYKKHPKPDANAPKKPSPSAYHLFALEQGERLRKKGYVFEDIARETGAMWRALSPQAVNNLEAKTTNAKNQYRKDSASYKRSAEYKAYQEYLKRWMAKEEAKKKHQGYPSSERPTPPAKSSPATIDTPSPVSATSSIFPDEVSTQNWTPPNAWTSIQSSAADIDHTLPPSDSWFITPELSMKEQFEWKWTADSGVTLAPDPLFPGMQQSRGLDMYSPFPTTIPMSSTISPSMLTGANPFMSASHSYAF